MVSLFLSAYLNFYMVVAENNKLNANEGMALVQIFRTKRDPKVDPSSQGCRKRRIRCKGRHGTRPNLSREGATQRLKHGTTNHDAWQRQSRCEAVSLGRGIVISRPQRGRDVRGGDQAAARRTRLPLLRAFSWLLLWASKEVTKQTHSTN